MPQYSFRLNGKDVQVDAPANLPALWALREKLGTTGPKYGCGIDVCKACTSHLDGKKLALPASMWVRSGLGNGEGVGGGGDSRHAGRVG